MEKTATRTRRGAYMGLVLVLAVVGIVGCGGDDDGATGISPSDDGGAGQAESSEDTTGDSGASADECRILETSEVEAQFGELGPVADAYMDVGLNCIWEIGDQEGFGTPEGFGDNIGVRQFRGDNGLSMEENWGPGEPVEGLADEAWFSGTSLAFREGDVTVGLTMSFDSEVVDARGKLIALAELILDRL